MVPPKETPAFNLKAVVHETGLKPDTLRAWERRYGLPRPERTSGGHRLYSQRDIDTVNWLITRQQDGLSISRAVDLWRKLEAEGYDPLQVPGSPNAVLGPAKRSVEQAPLEKLRDNWISACLAFSELAADKALSQAFALYPVETVCTEVLQAGLAGIGRGWHEGRVSVQQEHFASELAIRRLEALLAISPDPIRSGLILIGCPAGEEHTFSLLLLNLFLRRQGWETIYLGANIPVAQLKATVETIKSDLVIMAAQQLPAAANLIDIGQTLDQVEVPLAFGGLIFNRLPALRTYIPGHFLGERLDQAADLVESWLTSPQACSPVQADHGASETHRQILTHYLEQRGAIETDVWQRLQEIEPDLLPNALAGINKHMAQHTEAALMLGNLEFLIPDVTWVEELSSYDQLSEKALSYYVQAYCGAAQTHLAEVGQSLVMHLERLSNAFLNCASPVRMK